MKKGFWKRLLSLVAYPVLTAALIAAMMFCMVCLFFAAPVEWLILGKITDLDHVGDTYMETGKVEGGIVAYLYTPYIYFFLLLSRYHNWNKNDLPT